MSGTRAPTDQPATELFQLHAQQVEKMPPCQAQCPNSGDIRGWLGVIAQHKKNGLTLNEAYDKAWEMIADLNPLPATVARICPHPCEDLCSRVDKDGAVSINAMERFLGDWGISQALPLPRIDSERHPESIGVIGSGPASLSFAYQMARRGYSVTMYERHEVPGGMLRHAIPDYRLPREVLDAEVQRLLELDITLRPNVDLGNDVDLKELREQHALLFLGLGAQAARQLGIPGEQGPGVVSGIDYLRQRKQRAESLKGKRVLVIGGGNTAMDAARSAQRDGARVTVVYRRSEAEMPAIGTEVDDARAECVGFRFLVSPTRIIRDGDSIQGVQLQGMRLGEPDEQGRRRPLPIPGALQDMAADLVVVAVAQAPEWHELGVVGAADRWLRTQEDGKLDEDLWAGGDDRGPSIAARAIAQGRLAAESAHAELRGERRASAPSRRGPIADDAVKTDFYPNQQRSQIPRRPQQSWLSNPDAEINQTISYEQASEEAARCMSCGLCFDCQQCFMYCNASGFTRIEETSPGSYFALALEACEGCGKCIDICPCGYLEARTNTD